MRPFKRLFVISVIAATVAGGSQAWAAWSDGSMLNADGNLMTSVTTAAGVGEFADRNGAALSAAFRSPTGVLALPDGSVLVSDTRNHLIRKVAGGEATSFAGPDVVVNIDNQGFPTGGLLDGKLKDAFFQSPAGLAADAKGNIYVADAGNNAIRKIAADGTVTTLAGDGVIGSKDGKGAAARFYHPLDVAVAADGTVYVADTLNHLIRKIAADGIVTTLNAASDRVITPSANQAVPAGDFKDGDLKEAKFNEPSGLAIDAKGNLYVSDTGNQRIRYIDFASGKVTTVAGAGLAEDGISLYEKNALYVDGDFADGDASKALFNFPQGLAVTDEGGLLIADSLNHSVRYLFQGRVSTLAGDAATQSHGELDGIEGSGLLHKPSDVTIAADGSVWIADSFNNKLRRLTLYKLPADLKENGSPNVVLDNKQIDFDASPVNKEGRLMVPVRAIAKALGYSVEYNDETGLIKLTKSGSATIEMTLGKQEITRIDEGKPAVVHSIDAAPYISPEGRSLVPVRFFAEEIGLDVQWNQEHQTAILRNKLSLK